jgi:hypothetical protein
VFYHHNYHGLRIFIAFLIIQTLVFTNCIAQTKPGVAPFGNVDIADLKLTDCSYEKGANAEILFDYADVNATVDSLVMLRHKRIKIFNANAIDLANIRLPYHSGDKYENIPFIEAQTIRLENDQMVITKVDPKLVYTEVTDKNNKALVFTFPEVKPGCIIEYRYKFKTTSPNNFPIWFFQSDIPTRYSELAATISKELDYNMVKNGKQAFVKDTSETVTIRKNRTSERYYWAKANVRSFSIEPYMPAGNLNLQYLRFQLHSVTAHGSTEYGIDTWMKVVGALMLDPDFRQEFIQNLSKEDAIIDHADKLPSDEAKISYLFDLVKSTVKWNNMVGLYPKDGVKKAWSQKTGNATEINMILYNLLAKCKILTFPLLVSTPENGALTPDLAGFSRVNKVALLVPIDSTRYYVLDASNKYNVYNEVPADMINTQGLQIFPRNGFACKFVELKTSKQAIHSVTVHAEIKPDGTLAGTAKVTGNSYVRAAFHQIYDIIGQKKFEESLSGGVNNIKITKLDFENMATDSLPLIQNISFSMDSPGSDETYIYFNPNIFTPLETNPFTNAERFSDIDLGYLSLFVINGHYKLPAGYKIDVMPKNGRISMEDKGITFSKIQEERNGYLEMNCTINFKRSAYTVDEYIGLSQFYKAMFDMLNTPVVLKKVQ